MLSLAETGALVGLPSAASELGSAHRQLDLHDFVKLLPCLPWAPRGDCEGRMRRGESFQCP